jgi:cysteine sulfinate desulfinase/cysteine desulfurase-like protein
MAERQDLIVKWWTAKGPAMRLEIDDLLELISEKTCLVALTHACGVLGNIEDVEVAAEVVHRMVPEAVVCVDGVEFAPHRRVDVSALGVDIYVWSWNNVGTQKSPSHPHIRPPISQLRLQYFARKINRYGTGIWAPSILHLDRKVTKRRP